MEKSWKIKVLLNRPTLFGGVKRSSAVSTALGLSVTQRAARLACFSLALSSAFSVACLRAGFLTYFAKKRRPVLQCVNGKHCEKQYPLALR